MAGGVGGNAYILVPPAHPTPDITLVGPTIEEGTTLVRFFSSQHAVPRHPPTDCVRAGGVVYPLAPLQHLRIEEINQSGVKHDPPPPIRAAFLIPNPECRQSPEVERDIHGDRACEGGKEVLLFGSHHKSETRLACDCCTASPLRLSLSVVHTTQSGQNKKQSTKGKGKSNNQYTCRVQGFVTDRLIVTPLPPLNPSTRKKW